jgi:hypothetical protein
VSRFLAAAAVALGHLLGLVRPIAVPRPDPLTAPLVAAGTGWLPLRPLGLPGEYTPTKGGAP